MDLSFLTANQRSGWDWAAGLTGRDAETYAEARLAEVGEDYARQARNQLRAQLNQVLDARDTDSSIASALIEALQQPIGDSGTTITIAKPGAGGGITGIGVKVQP